MGPLSRFQQNLYGVLFLLLAILLPLRLLARRKEGAKGGEGEAPEIFSTGGLI